jgi:hypothetical protein
VNGQGAFGRFKIVYLTQSGAYASASADGAGLMPSTAPAGYKQSL